MAWPVQQLLLLMVLVYNIGIPAGNCVGGTDNVAFGDEEGIGGVDEGGKAVMVAANFPLIPVRGSRIWH